MTPRSLTIAILTALVLTAGAAEARYPQGQAITYSDFSFIRWIAASNTHTYFATTEGITRYDQFARKWVDPLTGDPSIPDDDIQRVYVSQFDDKLYIGTTQGNYEYDFGIESWFPITDIPPLDGITKHIDPPTVMLPPAGFNFTSEGQFIDPDGRFFNVTDVLDDGTGKLWFGTWGLGAAEGDRSSRYLDMLPFGLLQDNVASIWEDPEDQSLWMGGPIRNSVRTGLTGFDPDKMTFTYLETGVRQDLPVMDINCIEGDKKSFYLGTPFGLYIVDRFSQYVTQRISTRNGLLADNVLSLEITGDTLYVGTEEGLSILMGQSDSSGVIHPTQFSGQRIWDIEQVDGTIWIGATSGAYRFTPSTRKLQRYTDPDQVLFGDVYDIQRSGDWLWFVSDAGLVELNLKTAESESFPEAVQRMMPRALAVNDRIAAVASDKGLTILFHDRAKPYTRDFTTDDGLASNNIYALLMDGDFLWVGTDRGLTRFLWNNPDRVD